VKKRTKQEGRMFATEEEYRQLNALLESWRSDPRQIKNAFLKLKAILQEREQIVFKFISRPGVSYSLRANFIGHGSSERGLFALVDVIDDDPAHRWLSVCFYSDTVTDPEETGNLIPAGILGEDGYCFDVHEDDASLLEYIEQRIKEALARTGRLTEA
jgi:hypothetical protein